MDIVNWAMDSVVWALAGAVLGIVIFWRSPGFNTRTHHRDIFVGLSAIVVMAGAMGAHLLLCALHPQWLGPIVDANGAHASEELRVSLSELHRVHFIIGGLAAVSQCYKIMSWIGWPKEGGPL
jgi:hypothetical protein